MSSLLKVATRTIRSSITQVRGVATTTPRQIKESEFHRPPWGVS